jgi:hypothetical protein
MVKQMMMLVCELAIMNCWQLVHVFRVRPQKPVQQLETMTREVFLLTGLEVGAVLTTDEFNRGGFALISLHRWALNGQSQACRWQAWLSKRLKLTGAFTLTGTFSKSFHLENFQCHPSFF